MNRFGLAVRRRPAGKRKDLGSIPASALLSHQKGCGFWTLSCDLYPSLPTEILKWLSSLPILMHKSFWWYSNRYMISLSPHLHTPAFPPFSPSLISCKVSFLRTLCTMFTLHIQKLCRPVKHYGVTRKACLVKGQGSHASVAECTLAPLFVRIFAGSTDRESVIACIVCRHGPVFLLVPLIERVWLLA